MTTLAAVLMGGAAKAQQPTPTDIWRMAPPNSLLVAGFDWRSDNPSMQAIMRAQTPESQDLIAKQQCAIRKAVEDLATLFGISLDFAKDIQSWAGQQWAIVVLPDGKKDMQPVFMVASSNAAEANATLQKILAPWQRIGDVTPQPDSDYPITAFKTKDKSVEIYASASGPVVAVSPSKASLKQALQCTGFAVGSPGDKAFKALSGSIFYMYADPSLLKRMDVMGVEIPMSGLGLGVSAVDAGIKVRALGYITAQGAAFLGPLFPTQQPGSLTVNPGIPSTCLVAASLPDVSGLAGMSGMLGMSKSPILSTVQALSETELSAAVTAVLPMPAGVATAMAASDEAAAEKLVKITSGLTKLKLAVKPSKLVSGIQATPVIVSEEGRIVYLAQIGKYVVLATDPQSLAGAAATIKGEQPSVIQTETYKETIANLDDSNILTTYVNLAPVQGVGYLADSMGIAQLSPLYGTLAKDLQNMQAMGLGVGFNGDTVSATIFLRAKPEFGAEIGPAAIAVAPMTAAVLFPVFARARESARKAECSSNLKQLTLAAQIYASDHNGKLPTSAKWQSQIKDYLQSDEELECSSEEVIYAFNKNLSGLYLDNIKNPSDVVMFFEAEPGLPNATGSRADATLAHNGQGWFAYADGHVWGQPEVPDQSHWVPKYTSPKPVKKAPAKKAPVHAKHRR